MKKLYKFTFCFLFALIFIVPARAAQPVNTPKLVKELGFQSTMEFRMSIPNVPQSDFEKETILKNSVYKKYTDLYEKIKHVTIDNYQPKTWEGKDAAKNLVEFRKAIEKYLAKYKELKKDHKPTKDLQEILDRYQLGTNALNIRSFVDSISNPSRSMLKDSNLTKKIVNLHNELVRIDPNEFDLSNPMIKDSVIILYKQFLDTAKNFVKTRKDLFAQEKKQAEEKAAKIAAEKERIAKRNAKLKDELARKKHESISASVEKKNVTKTSDSPSQILKEERAEPEKIKQSTVNKITNRYSRVKGGWKFLKWGMIPDEVEILLKHNYFIPLQGKLKTYRQQSHVWFDNGLKYDFQNNTHVIGAPNSINMYRYFKINEGFTGNTLEWNNANLPYERSLTIFFYQEKLFGVKIQYYNSYDDALIIVTGYKEKFGGKILKYNKDTSDKVIYFLDKKNISIIGTKSVTSGDRFSTMIVLVNPGIPSKMIKDEINRQKVQTDKQNNKIKSNLFE